MSADELATFLEVQLNRNDDVLAMQEPVGTADGQFSIGCGWFSRSAGARTVVQHGGGGLGSGSLAAMVPADDFGIAVLTNSNSGNQLKLEVVREVLHRHLGIAPADPPVSDDGHDPGAYTGRYEDTQRCIDVGTVNERLSVRVETKTSTWPFPTSVPELYTCELGFYAPDRTIELAGPGEAAGREFGHEFIRQDGRPMWIRMASRVARRRA